MEIEAWIESLAGDKNSYMNGYSLMILDL